MARGNYRFYFGTGRPPLPSTTAYLLPFVNYIVVPSLFHVYMSYLTLLCSKSESRTCRCQVIRVLYAFPCLCGSWEQHRRFWASVSPLSYMTLCLPHFVNYIVLPICFLLYEFSLTPPCRYIESRMCCQLSMQVVYNLCLQISEHGTCRFIRPSRDILRRYL